METNIGVLGCKAHVKVQAFAAAVRAVGWPWRALAVVGAMPPPMPDWLYDWIAQNRYRFGRQACPVPSPFLQARLIE